MSGNVGEDFFLYIIGQPIGEIVETRRVIFDFAVSVTDIGQVFLKPLGVSVLE